ncbi:unnamed protein product, partial [Musa hybrid cultivar]
DGGGELRVKGRLLETCEIDRRREVALSALLLPLTRTRRGVVSSFFCKKGRDPILSAAGVLLPL